jgi:uncharacterized membrane protein YuzA (DUF378 family)
MMESSRSFGSRILAVLMACLAALMGFFAFNVVDGVFGFVESLVGLAACIATTVFVYRRSPPAGEDTNV